MKDKQEVIKHSAAIQIENNITLLQRRAWNVLLAYAYDELPSEEEHSIKVKKLTEVLEFDSKNDDYLKEALEALLTCKLKWNILGKDREIEWGVTTLLAQAKIRNGVCTYAYSPELRRRLHNPRMYARISLSMQNKFNSKYAQALWELCVDYLNESKNYGETPFISLTTYRGLMGISDDLYQEFKRLSRRTILDAIDEINKVTDFRVDVEYRREGKKVTAVKFKVRRVLLLPGQIGKQGALFPELLDMPPAVMELKNAGLAADEAWRIWQEGFNYVEEGKRPFNVGENAEAAFDKYVLEKIHLLKRRQAEGKVKNITGFLREAIRKNYANPEYAEEEKRKETQQRAKLRATTERNRQKLEERRGELTRAREREAHRTCEQVVKENPAFLDEALEVVFKENPAFKRRYLPEKSPLENYESPMFWVFVDKYLEKRHPERFQEIRAKYDSQITGIIQEIEALGKVEKTAA